MRRARRLAFGVDVGRVDRKYLALEATFGPRLLRTLLRHEAERVAVGAGNTPLVGDALGAFELARQFVVFAVRRRVRATEVLADTRTERDTAHRFDSTRERDVDDPGRDHG